MPRFGAAFSLAVIASGLAAAQGPAFEAATIKRTVGGFGTGPGARHVGFSAGGFTMLDGAAMVLLRSAWPDTTDVVGAPDWVSSEHYDVHARTGGPANREQQTLMLRRLLAERFGVTVREERRERAAFALVLDRADGRLGPMLRPYAGDCAAASSARANGTAIDLAPPSNGAPPCGMMRSSSRLAAGGISMDLPARNLRSDAGRHVVDRTGLAGAYELTLEMSPDVPIVTAVREQLGIELEPTQASLPVLVVERIERPTAD